MKYGLLVSRTLGNGGVSGIKNIGDYIQTLAALQFMPHVDEYFDKTADDMGVEKIKMIMNGWYIWQPEKFPVSSRIIPLPISMHISPVHADRLLSLDYVFNWFKKNEPIGCRDKETERILSMHGIKSYFSGCLTLTLGEKYKTNEERKGLIFVDPYLTSLRNEKLSFFDILLLSFFCLCHLKTYKSVFNHFNHYYCNGRFKTFKKSIYTAIFLKIYSKLFSFNELSHATFVTHMIPVGEGTQLQKEEEKIKYAESLVKQYARAKLVVTSRIHCGLPCLGVETPVILTLGPLLEEKCKASKAGRLDGIKELFYIAKINKFKLSTDFILPIKNKDLYKSFVGLLKEKCINFVKE